MVKNSLWRVRMLLGKATRVSNFSTFGNRLIKKQWYATIFILLNIMSSWLTVNATIALKFRKKKHDLLCTEYLNNIWNNNNNTNNDNNVVETPYWNK